MGDDAGDTGPYSQGRHSKGPQSKGRQDEERQSALKEAGPYLTLGLELGFTMIVWSGIGYVLDIWLETLPWCTLAGVFVGMFSLFRQLLRAARKSDEASKRRRAE
ncbi:MAG: AtpZ/AtpI family protein [Rhodothermales bacterium]